MVSSVNLFWLFRVRILILARLVMSMPSRLALAARWPRIGL